MKGGKYCTAFHGTKSIWKYICCCLLWLLWDFVTFWQNYLFSGGKQVHNHYSLFLTDIVTPASPGPFHHIGQTPRSTTMLSTLISYVNCAYTLWAILCPVKHSVCWNELFSPCWLKYATTDVGFVPVKAALSMTQSNYYQGLVNFPFAFSSYRCFFL